MLIASLVMSTSCSEQPLATEYLRTESRAISQLTPTTLGEALGPISRAHPGKSGFRFITTGQEALLTRIALAEGAEKTLDLQYYSVHDDATGQLMLEAILRAAERGVRVRLLVDDIDLNDVDDALAVLNNHPQIEIRVFNPYTVKDAPVLARMTNWLTDWDRISRRMHNKTLIADNQLSITGGRNLGNEYFDENSEFNFHDLDVLAGGPITARISGSFDRYWNSDKAYPIAALKPPATDPERSKRVRDELKNHWNEVMQSEAGRKLRAVRLAKQIKAGEMALTWASAELAADVPEKLDQPTETADSKPAERLDRLVDRGKEEFIAVSPYFVPQDDGVHWLKLQTDRGMRVRILTNSLASTDVVAVHTGYRRYREAVVDAGVELYEFKPLQGVPRGKGFSKGSSARASLHSKVYVVDRAHVVIGSFNLDPRSISLNTEIALVIHSREMAGQIVKMFEESTLPATSYRIRRETEEDGDLVWVTQNEDGSEERYYRDPEAGAWRNILSHAFEVLPMEDQL